MSIHRWVGQWVPASVLWAGEKSLFLGYSIKKMLLPVECLNVPGERLDPAHDVTFVGIFEGLNEAMRRVWKSDLLINYKKYIFGPSERIAWYISISLRTGKIKYRYSVNLIKIQGLRSSRKPDSTPIDTMRSFWTCANYLTPHLNRAYSPPSVI